MPARRQDSRTWDGNHTLVVISNLAVATGSLPAATVAVPHSAQLEAAGGIGPYDWSVSGLPAGLSIDPAAVAIIDPSARRF